MIAKKIIRRVVPASTATLSAYSPLLQRIYAARHIENERQLARGLKALLPFDGLKGISTAINLLLTAIMQQQRILVVGDYDADGATSTALAIRALKSFGAQSVNYLVPNRFDYGYGLSPALVTLAQQQWQPQLLITVDNGISSIEGVALANQLGISVLVTDHHLAGEELPAARAIVNPNQPDCPFPSKCLAGVGVLFYVMLALRSALRQNNWFAEQQLAEPNMASLLDLVALGTVADLVPLDHNNRILVYQGLQRISSGCCVTGISALLIVAKRQQSGLSAADLAFAVAPRLNAAGRLQDMSLGVECLLSDDPAEAQQFAQQLQQLNQQRSDIEQEMKQQAFSYLEKLQFSQQPPPVLCLFDKHWHQGVIGILASRIKDQLHRPVVVFASDGDEMVRGSARSIAGIHMRDLLAMIATQNPQLITKFGGHAMAAGLSLAKKNLKQFEQCLLEAVKRVATAEDLQACLFTDGELEAKELNLKTAELLRQSGPWGQSFPEPVFDGVFQILEQYLVGEKHLKLHLQQGDQQLDAIAFFVDTNVWPNHHCQKIRIVYKLTVNEYRGVKKPQLIIDYLEVVSGV